MRQRSPHTANASAMSDIASTGSVRLDGDEKGPCDGSIVEERPGPYSGLHAVLATMHGKEAAIAPVLQSRLGLTIRTAPHLDTDALGTFTGEIPRAGTIREAAVAKARLGMEATGLPIGLASEGSYGPHPHIPFVPGGVELMVLVDDTRGIVVAEHLIDDAPTFAHIFAKVGADITPFLARIGFPDHALIVRPTEGNGTGQIFKGHRIVQRQFHRRTRTCSDRHARAHEPDPDGNAPSPGVGARYAAFVTLPCLRCARLRPGRCRSRPALRMVWGSKRHGSPSRFRLRRLRASRNPSARGRQNPRGPWTLSAMQPLSDRRRKGHGRSC
jgi:hypothetical protein